MLSSGFYIDNKGDLEKIQKQEIELWSMLID